MRPSWSTLLRLCLLLAVIALPLSAVHAQEPGSPEDNACNPGGAMAGKCDTDWEWVCGYYLARWFSAGGWGAANNNALPSWCSPETLLPPRPTVDPITGVAIPVTEICKDFSPTLYCLRSDNTGTHDITGTPGIDYPHVFGNFPSIASCPPPPPGYSFTGYNASTNVWLGIYTALELYTILGLGPNDCFYYN